MSPVSLEIIKARIKGFKYEIADEYDLTYSLINDLFLGQTELSEPIIGPYSPHIDINRVEVIDNTGRAYTKYGVDTVQVSMQDGGKTMKVFLEVKGE